MQYFLFVLASLVTIFTSALAQNSSGFTEREKTQQAIDQNRKEVNQAGDANKPNQASTPTTFSTAGIDSSTKVTLDHSALVYGPIIEGGTVLMGFKFTSGVSLGYYRDQDTSKDSDDRRWRLTAGLELPGDYITNRLIWYLGGGAQLGRKGDKTSMYVNGGLDHRLLDWFKLQYGINWVAGGEFGAAIGAGLTF